MRATKRRTRPADWRHALSWTALQGNLNQCYLAALPKMAEESRHSDARWPRMSGRAQSHPNLDVASMMEYQC